MANKKQTNDSNQPDSEKEIKQAPGADQMNETASLAEEGPGGNPNKAGTMPGQEISEETPSPLADSIEAEKLDQYKKNNDEQNS